MRDYLHIVARSLDMQYSSFAILDGDQVRYYSPSRSDLMVAPYHQAPSKFCFETGEPLVIDSVINHPNYSQWEILHEVTPRALVAYPIRLSDGEVCAVLGTSRNRDGAFGAEEIEKFREFCRLLASELESRRDKAYAEASSAILESVLEAISDPLLVTDTEGEYLWANPAMRRVVGPNRRSVYEENAAVEVFDAHNVAIARDEIGLFRTLRQHETVEQEAFAISASYPVGRWVSMRSCPLQTCRGEILGAVLYTKDITARKLKELELTNTAARDPMTDLLNRRGFEQMANPLLSLTQRQGLATTLLCFRVQDLDCINEQLGRIGGDSLLIGFARLLGNCVRSSDLTARLGGASFLVLAVGPQPEVLIERVMSQTTERNQRLAELPELRWTMRRCPVTPGASLNTGIESILSD